MPSPKPNRARVEDAGPQQHPIDSAVLQFQEEVEMFQVGVPSSKGCGLRCFTTSVSRPIFSLSEIHGRRRKDEERIEVDKYWEKGNSNVRAARRIYVSRFLH
jgi:predicted secreted protein